METEEKPRSEGYREGVVALEDGRGVQFTFVMDGPPTVVVVNPERARSLVGDYPGMITEDGRHTVGRRDNTFMLYGPDRAVLSTLLALPSYSHVTAKAAEIREELRTQGKSKDSWEK
jgi:hypothetical protein